MTNTRVYVLGDYRHGNLNNLTLQVPYDIVIIIL